MNIRNKVSKNGYEHLLKNNTTSFNDGDLGGCNTDGDAGTECPKMWKYIVDKYNIKSVLDIGCGFGYHLKYFKDILNLEVEGVEGSDKVQKLSFYPEFIKCHDYTKGALKFNKIFDLGWSIEFVEHVDEQYTDNFLETFVECRYLIITHGVPGQAGHHHVNCQDSVYWINKLEKWGFDYNEEETKKIRELATEDFKDFNIWRKMDKNTRPFFAFGAHNDTVPEPTPYVSQNGLFFKNKNL